MTTTLLKKLVITSLSVFALIGCSGRTPTPDEVQIPRTDEQYQTFVNYINTSLEGEDKELAQLFLSEHPNINEYAEASRSALQNGHVIKLADIIAEQRKIKSDWAQTQRDINRVVEVVYINHEPMAGGGYDYRVKIRNKQSKPLAEIDGFLMFFDSNRDEAGRLALGYDHVDANETLYTQYQLKPNEGDASADNLYSLNYAGHFTNADYTSSDVRFEPNYVEFADGTKLTTDSVELLALAMQ